MTPTLAVLGAGAKAVAVAAKASVLREMGVDAPEVVAVERIGVGVIRRGGEKLPGPRRPVVGRRDGQVVLASEVMEEGAFGDARGLAQVIHRRRRIALCPDHMHGRVEKFSLR